MPPIRRNRSRDSLEQAGAGDDAAAHGRLVDPLEIADAVLLLVSPRSGSTSGKELVIDGGMVKAAQSASHLLHAIQERGAAKVQLQPLRPDHASKVLAFELANRTYFAAFVSDRGDAFFDEFSERYDDLLAQRETRRDAYYVLVDDDGSVLGRFNLYEIEDDTAEVGYRVAERVAGRGVATAGVRELSRLAASEHGVRRLRARTTQENVASQRVLTKAGFVTAGEADVAGRTGILFERADAGD